MKLYEIEEALYELVDAETGEITDEQKFLEMQGAWTDKVEGLMLWAKNLASDIDALDKEIKALTERKQVKQNRLSSLKDFLASILKGQKFETPRGRISYRKSKQIMIADDAVIPEAYLIPQEPKVDKRQLKADIEAGAEVAGVNVIEKENIQIK